MAELKLEDLAGFFRDHPEHGVASAYLFGSLAEGRGHRESDVDLGVLLRWELFPTRESRFERRVLLGSELLPVLHRNDLDLVVLNDAPPLFGRRIVTRGRRFFLAAPELDLAYLRDVQLLAADLAPFLARMREIKLAALAR